jgi:hypothetical protein
METVMAGLLQDVRLALRQLRKNLGFTISSMVMLAVAICANSTMLSWINGTMHELEEAGPLHAATHPSKHAVGHELLDSLPPLL